MCLASSATAGKVLKPDFTCVTYAADVCGDGYYIKYTAESGSGATLVPGNLMCDKCNELCTKCTGAEATKCTACVVDKGVFHDTATTTCKTCVANCKTCATIDTCTTCLDTFSLSSDKKTCAAASTNAQKITIGLGLASVAAYILAWNFKSWYYF